MTGQTDRATETTSNNGLGNPVKWTGMVRSTFRPSDDASIHQFLIPSNMMFARTLETASRIMEKLGTKRANTLVVEMRTMASEIRDGITKYGIISHPLFGAMYAFEVDGRLPFPEIYVFPWSHFTNSAPCRCSICSEDIFVLLADVHKKEF